MSATVGTGGQIVVVDQSRQGPVGPVGPVGPMGDITPEMITLRNEAQAASNSAANSAGIATTQAGIATTQAGFASGNAAVATTQAGIATSAATNAAANAASAASSAATLATLPAFVPATMSPLPVISTTTPEMEALIYDPTLNRLAQIPFGTLLSQENIISNLSVPSGGVVLVDPDGPGGYYNRSNSLIEYDVSSLAVATGVGGRNPKWIISEMGSTCRIDPGVNKTLLYDNMVTGEILSISNGESALVFRLDIASTSIGVMVVPSAADIDPTRVSISSTGSTNISADAYAPSFIHYVTGAGANLILPTDMKLYRPYLFSSGSNSFTLDPSAVGTRSFNGLDVGAPLTVGPRGSVTIMLVSGNLISVISSVSSSTPTRISISGPATTTLGDSATAPSTVHYVAGAGNIIVAPASPQFYTEYKCYIGSSPATISPGTGRNFIGKSSDQTVSAPAGSVATLVFITSSLIWLEITANTIANPAITPSYFGSGNDGALTISSGTTTISSDVHYTDLTINGTGALNTNGYRVFVSGTLDISAAGAGAIVRNGSPGVSGSTTAVTGLTAVHLGGSSNGSAGGAGGTAAGSAGTASVASQVVSGGDATVTGGAGGAGSSGAGGAAGAATARTSFAGVRRYEPNWLRGATLAAGGQSGAGGGGGGGDGTAGGAGGSAGTGGGVIWIAASTIARGNNTTAGIIQATGGNGGAGAAASAGNRGGGGGGAGGGGGCVYIVYATLTGTTITNAIQVNGGNGGNGGNGSGTGTAGNGGGAGDGGRVILGDLTTNTWTNTRSGTATAASGQTGGTGGQFSNNL